MSDAETDFAALRRGPALRCAVVLFMLVWLTFALFPVLWVAVMSLRLPVDALSSAPWDVLLGPQTAAARGGPSALALSAAAGAALAAAWMRTRSSAAAFVLFGLAGAALLSGLGGAPFLGLTFEHYHAVWIGDAFYENLLNSAIVTAGVVTISLTVGSLAGYALSRMSGRLALSVLIVALALRALPHSVIVAGYLPLFVDSRALLAPLMGDAAPTLYGQPWAVIVVLVAINQPFTIWMMQSFFRSVPIALDEAAMIDGCTPFQVFRHIIVPVMWPGVLTAGVFSFLLAYNDYLVCALLLDAQSQTMVPAITQYFNRETTATDQMRAIAAAVSITLPLIGLTLAFQRQLVDGLTAGAVKG